MSIWAKISPTYRGKQNKYNLFKNQVESESESESESGRIGESHELRFLLLNWAHCMGNNPKFHIWALRSVHTSSYFTHI